MPMLDVGFMLNDPMIATTFTLRTRISTDDSHGRVQWTTTDYPNQIGVITMQSPADLMRRDDSQMVPRRIFIGSQIQFVVVALNRQPDQVLWKNTWYTCEECYPYPEYGEGHYQAVFQSMNAVDPLL
jgi:hypothetical protein